MATTGRDLRTALEERPDDWPLYLIAADYCEEDGDLDGAYTLRWMHQHQKYPYRHMAQVQRPSGLWVPVHDPNPSVSSHPWCWSKECERSRRIEGERKKSQKARMAKAAGHLDMPPEISKYRPLLLGHYRQWEEAVMQLQGILVFLRDKKWPGWLDNTDRLRHPSEALEKEEKC